MIEPHPPLPAGERIAELECQVAELEAMRLLVGGLVHDFNNLLSAIAGHAALLEASSEPGSDARESSAAILRAAEHASAITRKLLDMTRPGNVRRVPVDLNATVAEIGALLKPVAGRGIRIEEKPAPGSVWTLGDPEQVHQLLLNLALNARDAMPDGGRLTLETGTVHNQAAGGEPAGGDWAMVAVGDTGPGIPESIREKIFEPFFTTRAAGEGTGLGLAVVAGIVQKHAGHLRVESREGCGTTIRVYLPLLVAGAGA